MLEQFRSYLEELPAFPYRVGDVLCTYHDGWSGLFKVVKIALFSEDPAVAVHCVNVDNGDDVICTRSDWLRTHSLPAVLPIGTTVNRGPTGVVGLPRIFNPANVFAHESQNVYLRREKYSFTARWCPQNGVLDIVPIRYPPRCPACGAFGPHKCAGFEPVAAGVQGLAAWRGVDQSKRMRDHAVQSSKPLTIQGLAAWRGVDFTSRFSHWQGKVSLEEAQLPCGHTGTSYSWYGGPGLGLVTGCETCYDKQAPGDED